MIDYEMTEKLADIITDKGWTLKQFQNNYDTLFDKVFPCCAITAKDYDIIKNQVQNKVF